MQPGSEKHHKRALKVAADVRGVESIVVTGRDRDLLQVSGDGVDESILIKKLRRVIGEAEIVDLRTVDAGYLPGTVAAAQSSYPVSAPSPLGHPAGAARWPGEQYRQAEAGYYPHAPSPSYYHASASPLAQAGHGGYGGGSGYARAAARSHPGNYSPMIDRHEHDYYAAGSSNRYGGGRTPKCCSIQ